ncbi:MAG: polysaccharide deacetylase family protein [Lentisphaerae bacterium]|nr:polysaccharide deacetylase family protein [Lentisphaerota bacterium]
MKTHFPWPNGARGALSLTFDDARPSQVAAGLPILDRHGVRATFYVSPAGVQARTEAWKQAAQRGHEIGNHTWTHPCSGNFAFVRANGNPLEDYTLERMEADIADADAWIERELGIRPQTFAYPCGETFVGRGEKLQSYSPLVARRYLAGRGFRQEYHNHPLHGDLARLAGTEADGASFAYLRAQINRALDEGCWLVLVAHEVGEKQAQALSATVLDQLCAHAMRPGSDLWVDTVAAVATHIAAHRNR